MTEKSDRTANIRHYRQMASTIVDHYLGTPATRIVYKSSGLTNYVFTINHVEGQFVIRISPDAERIEAFRKERWATQEARKVGVPAPEVLVVGSNDVITEPYMIARRVTGSEATHHPKRSRIIHELGRYAAIINSIKTNGFGFSFDWAKETWKYESWGHYLEREYRLDERLQFFAEQKLVSKAGLQKLRAIFDDTKALPQPALNHSDLRLKNVVVDEDGEIAAIIDWEECLSTVAPQWELSIALHDLSIDDKYLFIEGYGMSSQQLEEMSPLIKAFNTLNYYDTIRLSIEQDDHKKLSEIKLRLNGYFDLFSIPN